MKILYLTACYQSYPEYKHSYKYIQDTADKYGIPLEVYGIGWPQYPGWIEIKIEGMLRALDNSQDYTHVLYTDGRDAFFTKGPEAIESAYQFYGCPPILTSCSKYPQWDEGTDNPEQYEEYYPNGFMHNGGYIGEIGEIKTHLTRMLPYTRDYGDDCHIWHHLWTKGYSYEVDDKHLIFEVVQKQEAIEHPNAAIIHIAGGYSHPTEGKLPLLKHYYKPYE